MTHLEDFRKTLEEIHKEEPNLDQLNAWFLGAIAAKTASILDILEDMKNGDKL